MKTKTITFNLTVCIMLLSLLKVPIFRERGVGGEVFAQNVGINSTGATPDNSAMLDIVSADKGLLITRVALTSSADAATITTPATSLLVYNLGTGGLIPAGYYYNAGTTASPNWVRFITTDPCSQPIPTAYWPTFDATSPYILLGALWVGYDATAGCWKYNLQASGRGLTDPGNPNTWTVNGTTINYFDGDRNELPSGTHINNRYNPKTMAAKYSQDDIMVKTGNCWTDKYESRIIDVSTATWQDNDDNTAANPANTDIKGNGQGIAPTWMAFSQKNRGSSGMSWFVAQTAAANSGKRLIFNSEWQLAAKGTARTDATGMTVNGETWAATADQDVSMFGVVGMGGSLWEWTGDWGQYGPDNGVANGTYKYQGASYGDDLTLHVAGSAYTINTSQGGAAYITGLPAAIFRGGDWSSGTGTGVFAFISHNAPSFWYWTIGFRCAHN